MERVGEGEEREIVTERKTRANDLCCIMIFSLINVNMFYVFYLFSNDRL